MSTPPADDSTPTQAYERATAMIAFTARGDAALDQLAASLAAECDGSPTSITNLLERVTEADIEELAESLTQVTPPPVRGRRDSHELVRAAETPDDAARRRLAAPSPFLGGGSDTPGPGITR